MITTFGAMPKKMPAGFFKAIHFPVLATLDEVTYDHRKLLSSGAGARDLPMPIKFAPVTSAMGGHDGAMISGALFEVVVDPESGKMSGTGFLLNDENGRTHGRYVQTGAMRGNSIDLADVRARFVEDFDSGDYWIEFTEFKIGTTTGVGIPAFGAAKAEMLDELTEEELTAALIGDDPMEPLVCQFEEHSINIVGAPPVVEEVTASLGTLVQHSRFFMPEADRPTKIVVDADGNVYGHLAVWDTCHDGYADKCLRVPRPNDNYASFNKSGPLTEKGPVETGPIFALGGHRSAKSAATIAQAYGGIENAWADVRVTEGRFGPWISGIVRPGVSDDLVYAARASRISGHWVNGKLKAIVSVNAEGYDVPGSGDMPDFSTGFSFTASADDVFELVASFPACLDEAEEEQPSNQMSLNFTLNDDMDQAQIVSTIATTMATAGVTTQYWTFTPSPTTGSSTSPTITVSGAAAEQEQAPVADAAPDQPTWEDQRLADLLAEEDDDS